MHGAEPDDDVAPQERAKDFAYENEGRKSALVQSQRPPHILSLRLSLESA